MLHFAKSQLFCSFLFVFLVTMALKHMLQSKRTRTTPHRGPPTRATTDNFSGTQKKCRKPSASGRFLLLYCLSHPISPCILAAMLLPPMLACEKVLKAIKAMWQHLLLTVRASTRKKSSSSSSSNPLNQGRRTCKGTLAHV